MLRFVDSKLLGKLMIIMMIIIKVIVLVVQMLMLVSTILGFPMGMRIPPLGSKILPESNPLNSRIPAQRLAVVTTALDSRGAPD